MLNESVTGQATMIAYLDDFRLMLFLTLAIIPLLLLIRPPKKSALTDIEPDPNTGSDVVCVAAWRGIGPNRIQVVSSCIESFVVCKYCYKVFQQVTALIMFLQIVIRKCCVAQSPQFLITKHALAPVRKPNHPSLQ